MTILAQADELARAGRVGDAIALVRSAAAGGDVEAQLEVSQWLLFGQYGPRDHLAARSLLAAAAASGSIPAGRMLVNMTANGTGGSPDPPAARRMLESLAERDDLSKQQFGLLAKMAPPQDAHHLRRRQLADEPVVQLIEAFLTQEECSYLRQKAQPALQPSQIVDPATRRLMPNPIRTSLGMNFNPVQEDLVVQAINARIGACSGTDQACGELLHILCYLPGQEYRPHLDALPAACNQRQMTFLIYLNDGYSGGETHFPALDLKVEPRSGDAVLFHSLDAGGEVDRRSIHAGLPVTRGTKWLATRWIRREPYDPWSGA